MQFICIIIINNDANELPVAIDSRPYYVGGVCHRCRPIISHVDIPITPHNSVITGSIKNDRSVIPVA